MMRAVVPGLILIVALGGCGPAPRFDASTEEAANRSIKAMTAGMSKADREALAVDVLTVAGPTMIQTAFRATIKGEKVGATAVMKPIDGMTVAEIKAKARAVRAAMTSKP